MAIELRQLRYFVTVAEEMHFGRAAARLHMTQPPLSQSIRALELDIGTALFERTSRSVRATAAGRALLPEAQRLLQQANALPQLAMRAAAGDAGRLTIAFISIADYSVLPELMRSFRSRYPLVQIELREATSNVQIDELAAEKIDLGLLIPPLPERLREELDYRPVWSEPLVLAVPHGHHSLRKQGKLTLAAVADLPLLIFPRTVAPALHDAILSCFRSAGLTPVIGQEAIQMQTIVALVSAGMGIALVPQSVSNLQRPGVEYRGLQDKVPTVETGVAWRRDNPSPVLQSFLNFLKKRKR